MGATLYKAGNMIDLTAAAAITAGDMLPWGNGVAIAATDAAIGETFSAYISGVFSIPKSGAGSINFALGAQVDIDDTNQTAVATGGDYSAGMAWKAAANGDTEVLVAINVNAAAAAT